MQELQTLPPGSLRGASRPRVEYYPPSVFTYGPEACELAERAGLTLDLWQRDSLDHMLAVRDDGKYACFEYGEIVARQNGKSVLLAARALAGLFLLGEKLIMWSAHEYKTAMESFLFFTTLIEHLVADGLIDPVKKSSTNGEESFTILSTRQRLKFIARSKGSGRGFSGDVHLIDEAFAFTDIQQAALMPTLLAKPNPQIVYASSPPLDGETGGPLFDLRRRGEAGDSQALGWRDWSIPGDLDMVARGEIDLDDHSLWPPGNPSLGGRITEETIGRLRTAMSSMGFAREVLGIWPRQLHSGEGIIPAALWSRLTDMNSRITSSIVFAIDANPERTMGAIAAAGLNDRGAIHVEIVDRRPGVDWIVPRITELRAKHDPIAIVLDPAGPAGALVPDLDNLGFDYEVITGREFTQSCGAFYDDVVTVDGDKLAHMGDYRLDTAIAAAQKKDVGDAWAWTRKDSETDICPLVAVTLARHGYQVYGADPLENIF